MANKALLILIGFLIWSCDGVVNQPISDSCNDNCVRGFVYNDLGAPIVNADIFLTYDYDLIIDSSRPSTTIDFSLPSERTISLFVNNYCGDLINTIIDNESFSAGFHTITWDANNLNGETLQDGVYQLILDVGDEVLSSYAVLIRLPGIYQECENEQGCESVATTNSNGYFEFSQDCMSFGYSDMTMVDGIPSSLMLFAVYGGDYGSTEFFEVDESQGAQVNIYISNE